MKIFALSTLTVQHGATGGMERYLDLLVRGLAELGHCVTVLTTELHNPGNSDLIKIVSLPVARGERGKSWDRELRKFYSGTLEKPQILLSNSFVSHALLDFPQSIVTIIQGSGLVDLISAFRMLAAGRCSPFLCAKEIRNVLRDSYKNQRVLMHASARVLAVSEETRRSISRLYSTPPEKIEVIPAPVDTSTFHPDPSQRALMVSSANPVKIVSAGTLSQQKGFDVVLEALAILLRTRPEQFRLEIAGDGPERQNLQALSTKLGLGGAVNFSGRLNPKEMSELFRQNDLFVLATFREEGFPLVISEALASGLPVIATRVGGNPTAVRHGIDGCLVKAGSSRELAASIQTLAEKPELRLSMAKAARARALAELDKGVICRRVEAILKAVAAKG